jgi:hypothetical protein
MDCETGVSASTGLIAPRASATAACMEREMQPAQDASDV